MEPRIETRKVLAERRIDNNTVMRYVERLPDDPDATDIIDIPEPVTAQNRQQIGDWLDECQRGVAGLRAASRGGLVVNSLPESNLADLPVLEPPTYQNGGHEDGQKGRFSNSLPTLEPPKWKPRADKSVKNDPRKSTNETSNGLPILRTPGDDRR